MCPHHAFFEGRAQVAGAADCGGFLAQPLQRTLDAVLDRHTISAKLVDAFIAGGYTITCDLNDFDPEFKRSADRDGILAYMWDVEIVELHVHKGKTRGWLRLIFDENGWDLVQDYTVDLEHIVEPICEPYLPPGLRIGSPESGVRVLTLDSPDDVLKIEGMLK
jgi:hypothetical protein